MTATAAPSNQPSTRNHFAPAITLILLSPLIGEVMSGATKLSYLFAYIPEVMMWGCGTLLIRETVRRWGGNWTTMLPLGLALSVFEEFIVQQTSLAPFPWQGTAQVYGRVWGVNWMYFLFMLAFESICITLVPVQITELLFPESRKEPWLRGRGLAISSAIFVGGAFIAWFLWVKIARIQVFHAADYHAPLVTWMTGWLMIAALVATSYMLRRPDSLKAARTALSPWVILPLTLILGFPWYALMALVFVPNLTSVALWIPIVATIAWAVMSYVLVRFWTSAAGWSEMHDWSLSLGVLLVCMAAGFLGSSLWLKMDIIFKAALNVLAVVGMVLLYSQIRGRTAA